MVLALSREDLSLLEVIDVGRVKDPVIAACEIHNTLRVLLVCRKGWYSIPAAAGCVMVVELLAVADDTFADVVVDKSGGDSQRTV